MSQIGVEKNQYLWYQKPLSLVQKTTISAGAFQSGCSDLQFRKLQQQHQTKPKIINFMQQGMNKMSSQLEMSSAACPE